MFGIIVVTGINSITAGLTYKYLDIKNQYTDKNDYLAAITENGIWIKDKINGNTNIINANRLENNNLHTISIQCISEFAVYTYICI